MKSPTYLEQCTATTNALIKAANLDPRFVHTAFQSRMGRTAWIQPYTTDLLQQLPKQGVKNLSILAPSFFCDGLETLEELHLQAKEIFLQAGGKTFHPIPCPNSSPAAVACLKEIASLD